MKEKRNKEEWRELRIFVRKKKKKEKTRRECWKQNIKNDSVKSGKREEENDTKNIRKKEKVRQE